MRIDSKKGLTFYPMYFFFFWSLLLFFFFFFLLFCIPRTFFSTIVSSIVCYRCCRDSPSHCWCSPSAIFLVFALSWAGGSESSRPPFFSLLLFCSLSFSHSRSLHTRPGSENCSVWFEENRKNKQGGRRVYAVFCSTKKKKKKLTRWEDMKSRNCFKMQTGWWISAGENSDIAVLTTINNNIIKKKETSELMFLGCAALVCVCVCMYVCVCVLASLRWWEYRTDAWRSALAVFFFFHLKSDWLRATHQAWLWISSLRRIGPLKRFQSQLTCALFFFFHSTFFFFLATEFS